MASRSEEVRPLLRGDEDGSSSSSTARTLKTLATTVSFIALAVLCVSLVLFSRVNTPIDSTSVSG